MATFGALGFEERGGGGGRDFPAHGATFDVAVYIVPGGSPTIQPIGAGAASFTVPAQGTEAQLDALRGAAGSSDTLTYVGGVITARLKAVTNAVKVLDAVDLWRWDLEFIR